MSIKISGVLTQGHVVDKLVEYVSVNCFAICCFAPRLRAREKQEINGIHVYRQCLTLYSLPSRGIMGSMLRKVPADLASHKASTLC